MFYGFKRTCLVSSVDTGCYVKLIYFQFRVQRSSSSPCFQGNEVGGRHSSYSLSGGGRPG